MRVEQMAIDMETGQPVIYNISVAVAAALAKAASANEPYASVPAHALDTPTRSEPMAKANLKACFTDLIAKIT